LGRPDPRTSSRLAGILLAALVLSGCQSQVGTVEPSALDVTATPAPLPAAEPIGTSVPNVVGLALDVPKPRLQSSKSSKASERSSGSGSGSSVGTVHPGAFCDPPGSGVSTTGKPMVCGTASDGRNRWKSA
jgi:hypothetical protein